MFELKDLYQEVIVDHNRNPHNFGELADADRTVEGYNPLCGDKLNLYVKFDGDRIGEVKFDGSGCAISVASASLMTDILKGKTREEADALFNDFHELLTAKEIPADSDKLDKLAALAGVRDYPSRIKCATLCWHTLHSALSGEAETVTTE